MAEPTARITAIEPSLVQRIAQGVRYVVAGVTPDSWFGPMQPLPPVAQDQAAGRAFDYPVGFNQRLQPRGEEGVSFGQMRGLADAYDLLRLVIETRKDQVCAIPWTITPRDEAATPDSRADAIKAFLQSPDREHSWDGWLRMLLEDLFVIDAPSIYPRMTRGGDLYALELVDGSTIKRVLDDTGRTPLPPDPAYQQILKGVPAVDYTRDELLYLPRNPRSNRIYGYSPVEQIITTVNIALRRQLHQLQYYTEGSTPDLLLSVPPEWNPNQVAEFQAYWDALLAGNTAERRRARFIPSGVNAVNTKEAALKDEYDEWLARIVCFAFSVNPTPFLKQQNRATADNAAEQAFVEGLVPLMRWIKTTLDLVIGRWFGAPDLHFTWQDDDTTDALTQAQIDQIYVASRIKHPDEVRHDLGLAPLTPEQRAQLNPPAPLIFGDSFKLAKKKSEPRRLIATAAPSPNRGPRLARY